MDGHCLRQTFAPDTAGELHSTGGGGVRVFFWGESTLWGPELIVINGGYEPWNWPYTWVTGVLSPLSVELWACYGPLLITGRGPLCRVFSAVFGG